MKFGISIPLEGNIFLALRFVEKLIAQNKSMNSNKNLTNIAGWVVFTIAFIVYYLSAERVGSLWDCGEFIAGAYKLQVVHPPGAPLFLLIGRIFTWVASMVSDNPANIAFSVNLLSGICTAFAAMFVCWTTMILGKLSLKGRDEEPGSEMAIPIAFAGIIAGLSTAFATSIWFSAVEGEVYAMSTFFTAMTLWAMIKWYNLPDNSDADRWILFATYSAALSIGVHLLSLLTFPALALFYYFKKTEKPNLKGMAIAALIGTVLITVMQKLIITGIPNLWSFLEIMSVNTFGLPYDTGFFLLLLVIGGISYYLINRTNKNQNGLEQRLVLGALLSTIGFSIIGIVLLRANANPPINMNDPSDAIRVVPYLNREQYGERALLFGPQYNAKYQDVDFTDRYGRKDGRYEVVDHKFDYTYNNSDKVLFPRMSDNTQNRPKLYQAWTGNKTGEPTFFDNISFFIQYQIGWMYWRYFMWNFAGRQNDEQGYYSWDPKSGNWISGIKFIDDARLYRSDQMPDFMKNERSRNTYYFLPLILGLLGMYYHAKKRQNEFLGIMALFIITGIGIIIYSNQPPNEPRERDYVLAGSMFTFCIWIGLGVLALYQFFMNKLQLGSMPAGMAAGLLSLAVPAIMLTQNFDDHSRSEKTASRDYAANFLNSVDKNAIIFTYGDNDTYPLWYAQEVEGIRTDVRVVNLSLIAVDWYINQLARKVNDAPAIKLTIPAEAYRGDQRIQLPILEDMPGPISAFEALKFAGQEHPLPLQSGRSLESYIPSKQIYLPIDKARMMKNGLISSADSASVVPGIPLNLGEEMIMKDDLAVMDVISSNISDRPIYFAVTCREDKMLGLNDFMQLEGLALRIIPVRSQSDRRFSVIGNGRVAGDKLLENVTKKFKWGNFDKTPQFVSRYYMPSIQTTLYSMLRGSQGLVLSGQKEQAITLIDTYFSAFPNFNFTYDSQIVPFLQTYEEAGAYEKAKKQMKVLANNTLQSLKFYASLDKADLEAGFQSDYEDALKVATELPKIAEKAKDTAYASELKNMFKPYAAKAAPQMPVLE